VSTVRQPVRDTRVDAVVSELQGLIAARYPSARFEVFDGEDSSGTYLRAIADVDDPDVLTDLIIDRLLPLQVEDRLPLYFVAARRVGTAEPGRAGHEACAEKEEGLPAGIRGDRS